MGKLLSILLKFLHLTPSPANYSLPPGLPLPPGFPLPPGLPINQHSVRNDSDDYIAIRSQLATYEAQIDYFEAQQALYLTALIENSELVDNLCTISHRSLFKDQLLVWAQGHKKVLRELSLNATNIIEGILITRHNFIDSLRGSFPNGLPDWVVSC